MKKAVHFALPMVFAVALAVTARADVAPFPLRGGISAAPDKKLHQGIVMESEEVTLLLHDRPRVDIVASMVMKNPSNRAVSMVMGFPTPSKFDVLALEVRVNGQPVCIRGYSDTSYRIPPFWRVWNITLAPGSKTLVRVAYQSTPLKDWPDETREVLLRAKKDAGPGGTECREQAAKVVRWRVQYILQTGSLWDGPVDKIVVRVRHAVRGASVMRGLAPCVYHDLTGPVLTRSMDEQAQYWARINKALRLAGRTEVGLTNEDLTVVFNDVDPDFSLDFIYNPFLSADEERALLKKPCWRGNRSPGPGEKQLIKQLKHFHEKKQVLPFKTLPVR